jgi:hypothetical protein
MDFRNAVDYSVKQAKFTHKTLPEVPQKVDTAAEQSFEEDANKPELQNKKYYTLQNFKMINVQ